MSAKLYNIIGIMTGTSLDGIDAAILRTDGQEHIECLQSNFTAFQPKLREKLYNLINGSFNIKQYCQTEIEYTKACFDAIKPLLKNKIDMIGFHGQALYHDPANFISHQMGAAKFLQKMAKVPVINDFRIDDILNDGGQGAPLAPHFHRALIKHKLGACAVLNIGGVSNITYLSQNEMIAFDIGPGGAKLDEIMQSHFNLQYDPNGANAAKGKVDGQALAQLLSDDYFKLPAPKSLDRNHFNYDIINKLSANDQLATVSAFIVQTLKLALKQLPSVPKVIYLCGGGRRNKHLVALIRKFANVKLIDEIGIDGDMLEAYAFAYLAARKHLGLNYGTNFNQN